MNGRLFVFFNVTVPISVAPCASLSSFADGRLSLDCALYQKDWGVHLDVCENSDGNLVMITDGSPRSSYISTLLGAAICSARFVKS